MRLLQIVECNGTSQICANTNVKLFFIFTSIGSFYIFIFWFVMDWGELNPSCPLENSGDKPINSKQEFRFFSFVMMSWFSKHGMICGCSYAHGEDTSFPWKSTVPRTIAIVEVRAFQNENSCAFNIKHAWRAIHAWRMKPINTKNKATRTCVT